jgi:hypothetical protein
MDKLTGDKEAKVLYCFAEHICFALKLRQNGFLFFKVQGYISWTNT